MDEIEKIKIVLEEYKTLREEIYRRHAAFVQVCTVAGTTFVAIVGVAIVNKTLVGGAFMTLALLVLVTFAFLMHDHDTRLLAEQLAQIEKDINKRAGEDLLTWETTRGLLVIGYFDRMQRIWDRIVAGLSFNKDET
ncbi:MAG: hypothetical protein K8H87_04005 [Pseudorhodoplanes sp.]|nr:hypothetical protein [Pseudorhodoplanes sp.]